MKKPYFAVKYYFAGKPPALDDFGVPIDKVFYDGATRLGPWAFMTPESWSKHGIGQMGMGRGQKYEKQENGRWLKVEG